MQGCHRRMGDVWMPDRSLTIDELPNCLVLLEEDSLMFENDLAGRLRTGLTGFCLTAGYCAALRRGEEIPRLDLGGMRKYWVEALNHPSSPHVPYVLIGRFKNITGERGVPPAGGIQDGLGNKQVIVGSPSNRGIRETGGDDGSNAQSSGTKGRRQNKEIQDG
jgi:hypothetical protein